MLCTVLMHLQQFSLSDNHIRKLLEENRKVLFFLRKEGNMKRIYTSVEQLIGHTPLLELINTEKKYNLEAKIYAKLEYLNPAGSIKDRAAKEMLDDALRKGLIKKGSTIIEPTSGNTGIGLASVAVPKGYRVIIVMPDSMSLERIKIMKAYGAELVLTDGKDGMAGAIAKAQELAKEIPDSFIPDQFNNIANANAHYKTTGPEIFEDTEGDIDIFVASIGTGGTISGNAAYLKEKNPNIKVVGVEPLSSPFITKGIKGAHKIQGIGAGFIPGILNLEVIDEVMTISDEEAYEYGKDIGKTEGILVGISSGSALAAAVKLAQRKENKGKNIVVIFPDTGDRYLSVDNYF